MKQLFPLTILITPLTDFFNASLNDIHFHNANTGNIHRKILFLLGILQLIKELREESAKEFLVFIFLFLTPAVIQEHHPTPMRKTDRENVIMKAIQGCFFNPLHVKP